MDRGRLDLVSLVIGIVLGLIAGYGPRWLDALLLLAFDALKSFPSSCWR
jgi:peptide/nickel transport system permease protein